ncbi:NAD(P)/FAD-dependent oxidoreductase [Polyangium aurulentum]|uniref:NAD(P)/FAD-dependent oxidoreductase n=1 Tax=Polyangium aurulentum TaxID=2567896 RepID=UPI0010ADE001|nr:NAD(P)/FAD-dependent oxidoreductase [Polyangium aurulentum]
MERFDVLIVGGGPAGLAAGLVLGRCRRRVLLCDAGKPRNAPSRAMHGYLTRDGLPPSELRRIGREEVRRYGVELRDLEVVDARRVPGGGFEADLADGATIAARKLILATGMKDVLPEIAGFREFYGRGVYPCPYCDGWEMQDQPIGVFACGDQDKACRYALMMLRWSRDIVFFHHDNGAPPTGTTRELFSKHGITMCQRPIARLEGDDGRLARVVLEGGQVVPRRALFIKIGERPHSKLPERLGCDTTEEGVVGEARFHGATDVDGLYVVGDASPRVQLVSVAAAEGAAAAVNLNMAMQMEDLGVECK